MVCSPKHLCCGHFVIVHFQYTMHPREFEQCPDLGADAKKSDISVPQTNVL
jgi:hypothetical protein